MREFAPLMELIQHPLGANVHPHIHCLSPKFSSLGGIGTTNFAQTQNSHTRVCQTLTIDVGVAMTNACWLPNGSLKPLVLHPFSVLHNFQVAISNSFLK